MLLIKWTSDYSRNYVDLIPEQWLSLRESRPGQQHDVRGPRGKIYKARCDVIPNAKFVDIDYRPYTHSWGNISGVLRIVPKSNYESFSIFWDDEDCSKCTELTFEADELSALEDEFDSAQIEVRQLSDADLKSKLELAPKKPAQRRVLTTVFTRNACVVEFVRRRAAGRCENCGARAPFDSRTTGEPYLEVHHKVRLADQGDDTIDNAQALCPNCHRQKHFG